MRLVTGGGLFSSTRPLGWPELIFVPIRVWIDHLHLPQRAQEHRAEIVDPVVIGAELALSAVQGTNAGLPGLIRCSRCVSQAYRSNAIAECPRARRAASS